MNERIILFDTSVASYNKGDEIIMRSIKKTLKNWLDESDVYYLPTHIPCFTEWQDRHPNYRLDFFKNIPTKLLCGTDIICKNRQYHFGQWDMNYNNASVAQGVVTLAVGYSGNRVQRRNPIRRHRTFKNTEQFYGKILNQNFIHSTRDEVTAEYLRSIRNSSGEKLKAINTGCVTTWCLSPDFCKSINTKKRESVVFTLNCRTKEFPIDTELVSMLLEEYKQIMFWPQQWEDVDYFNQLKNVQEGAWNRITMLPMSVDKLEEALSISDYVGMRLHCGIFAMQNKCKSIILQADHRSKDISENQNLNLFSRNDIEGVRNAINTNFVTNIYVNYDNINTFLKQFGIELVVAGERVYSRKL